MKNDELAYLNRLVKIGIIDARFRNNFKPIIHAQGLVYQSKDTEKYYILETPDGVFKEAVKIEVSYPPRASNLK